jgi:transcriptional regulator with XRE-family HTH domain
MTYLARDLRLLGVAEVAIELRARRKRCGVTQPELARAAGLHIHSISRYELGRIDFKPATLARVHAALERLAVDAPKATE